jgi:hypothetical protein
VEVEPRDLTGFIKRYIGEIVTGFAMRGGSHGPSLSKIMGAEDNPPLALRRSVDTGMAPDEARRHIDYLEIYEGGVRR